MSKTIFFFVYVMKNSNTNHEENRYLSNGLM